MIAKLDDVTVNEGMLYSELTLSQSVYDSATVGVTSVKITINDSAEMITWELDGTNTAAVSLYCAGVAPMVIESCVPDTIARVEDIPEAPDVPDNIVQSVNGVTPDENGNVEVEIPEIPEIPQEVFIANTSNTFAEVYAAVSSGKACFATDGADGGFLAG